MSELNPEIPEPDEKFISALEHQLREGIRRRAMLDSTNHRTVAIRRKGTRMLATASLMFLSLMLGAAGTYTVVHEDPAPQRELHVQKAAILLERAQLRLEQRQADLTELLPLVEQGLADQGVAAQYEQKVSQAGLEVQRRELDLKETAITGRPPVDDLAGPLIAGEDFITRRLELQQQVIALDLQGVKTEFSRTELLAQRGIILDHELIRAGADLEEAELVLSCVQERIDLRRSFLNGEMAAEEVELRAMSRDAESECAAAQSDLRVARLCLQRVAALHDRGATTNGELHAAQAAVRDGESSLALAELQLTMIRQRLEVFEQHD